MSGDGTLRLPPGQVETHKFPVVGERQPPAEALDLERWRLRVDGLVEQPLTLTYAEVLAFPQAERVVDIHCVTGWSQGAMRFTGLPLSLLLERARPLPAAGFVRFTAWSERDHDTTLPLALALADCWLVHGLDGRPLAPEHGFPLRTVTPSRYFYKSLKWVRRIELLREDAAGYWERESSYHQRGDPWAGDERFTTGSVRPEELARFKAATSFARFRRKVLLGLDLRGWEPSTLDLRELQLKNCDLRGARLVGVDLRGGNLSLSDLRDADLRDADLRGADLEGGDFSGADLTGADLRDTALSATRFFTRRADGTLHAAAVRGMLVDGSTGLVEEQEAFLAQHVSPDP